MINKSVLVTGGAGYLGSVLCHWLHTYGYCPTIVDIGWNGFDHVVFPFWQCNVTNLYSYNLEDFDSVIHLASVSRASLEQERDSANIENHERETAHLISCLRGQKLIFASSASVYGSQGNAILTEDSDCVPVCRYGKQKFACEKLVLDYGGDCLRMGTLMGPSPLMRHDLVVNAMVWSAIVNREIKVWGSENCRPHLNVADAARAYIFFLNTRKIGGVFNVAEANRDMLSLAAEVAECVSEKFGKSVPTRKIEGIEPRSYCVDNRSLGGMGFTPHLGIWKTVDQLVDYYSCCEDLEKSLMVRLH